MIVAIISCIARSMKISDNAHLRAENCSSKCLLLEDSKYIYRSIVFSDKVLLHIFIKNKHLITQNNKIFEMKKMEDITGPRLIIPEERNISLKLKKDQIPDDHANLLKRFKAHLTLPNSPLLPKDYCSKRLLQLMTREDKIIWDLIDTKRPDDQWASTESIWKPSQRTFR